MGAVELVLRQDLPRSFVQKCATGGEDDDAFCRLIYRFTVNKMMRKKYQSGRKTRTNERHDETSERGRCELQQI